MRITSFIRSKKIMLILGLLLILQLSFTPFTISGAHDSSPPEVESVEVSPKKAKVGDTIKIKAKITDDISGVSHAFIYYRSPSDTRDQDIALTENTESGYWEGSYTVKSIDEAGEWQFKRISAVDYAGHHGHYYPTDIENNINFSILNGSVETPSEENLPYHVTSSNETWTNKVDIPMDIQYNGSEKVGLLIVEGKTLPFLKVFIDGTEVTVHQDGYFKVEIENKNENISVIIRDVFGNETIEISYA